MNQEADPSLLLANLPLHCSPPPTPPLLQPHTEKSQKLKNQACLKSFLGHFYNLLCQDGRLGLVGVVDGEECMPAVLVAVLPIEPEVVTLPILRGSQEAGSEC